MKVGLHGCEPPSWGLCDPGQNLETPDSNPTTAPICWWEICKAAANKFLADGKFLEDRIC
jgi:hypothetical protein